MWIPAGLVRRRSGIASWGSLDDARQQRLLVHVVKRGESCSARVRPWMTSKSAELMSSRRRLGSSTMKSCSRLERRSLNWSRSRAEHGTEDFSPRMSAKESLGSLASQRSTCCWRCAG